MKLCSACLLGVNCRYNGEKKPNEKVLAMAEKEVLIPVCPEQLGGLPTPRVAAEIKDNKIINQDGGDYTEQFRKGAEEVLKIAKLYHIKKAILKQRSPSCGFGLIYGGDFSGDIIKGNGITAQLLQDNGIEIITEEDL